MFELRRKGTRQRHFLKNILTVWDVMVLRYGMGGRRRVGQCLFHEKVTDEQGDLFEAIIWKVPVSSKYSEGVRYRLAFIRSGEKTPAVLYDNHHPKGHHRHYGQSREPYEFLDVDRLLQDFRDGVHRLKEGKA